MSSPHAKRKSTRKQRRLAVATETKRKQQITKRLKIRLTRWAIPYTVERALQGYEATNWQVLFDLYSTVKKDAPFIKKARTIVP